MSVYSIPSGWTVGQVQELRDKILELEAKLAGLEEFKLLASTEITQQDEKLKVAVEALEIIEGADGHIAPCDFAGEIEGVAREALEKIKSSGT